MFDPKNKLHFIGKSVRDKLHEISKPSEFIKLSEEDKAFINKCKLSKHFNSNKNMKKKFEVIYNKLFEP